MAVCWAYITPELMVWARRKSGLSYASIAERMKVTVERLKLCERGTKRLTFRQAQKYAKVTDIPFGYLSCRLTTLRIFQRQRLNGMRFIDSRSRP